MKKQLFTILACLLASALPVAAQKGAAGNWSWEGTPDKNKVQNTVWLDLKQTGNRVKGAISIAFYDPNGEDGSDAPVVAFIGTVTGDVIAIEFDADDTSALDGGPLPTYTRHKGGPPNTATLKLVNGKLEFTQTKGSIGEGYPHKFILTRGK
jgi:hypothetical protein